MKILTSGHFTRVSEGKYPEAEVEPYNPWAVCNKSTGGKEESPEKFERCVHHLKEQNKEENTKDVRPGRSVHYRTNETPDDVFQQRLDDEFSGKAEQEKEQRLDDVWLDALQKYKHRERQQERNREPVFSFVILRV